jgi:dihydrofolate reductase
VQRAHKRWYIKSGSGQSNEKSNLRNQHYLRWLHRIEYFIRLLRDDAGLLVYGRKTYQLMVPYWPDIAKSQSETKADIEFAQAFVSKKKIVFSRSLASAEDGNTRIVRTNLHDEILKLKQEPGKDILVGGVDVPSQLTELGLIDDYRFVVMPIIAGEGRRLFEDVNLQKKLRLKLAESKIFESGCAALRYVKQVTEKSAEGGFR